MRKAGLQTFFVVVLFILVVSSVVLGVYFYQKEYKETIVSLKQSTENLKRDFSSLRRKISGLQSDLDFMSSSIKEQTQQISSLMNNISETSSKQSQLSSQIGILEDSIKTLERKYLSAIDDLRKKVANINQAENSLAQKQTSSSATTSKPVKLGEIFINKKKTSPGN